MTHETRVPPGGWQHAGAERFATGPSTAQRAFLAGTKIISGVEPSNVFALLQHSPRLFFPWLAFASRLMPYGKIEANDRERVILRVAWNCRCRYEWGQHVAISRNSGLPREELAWIAAGPAHPGWDAHRRALLAACDEFHADRLVSDRTWAELLRHHDDEQRIELLLLIGHYEMLAGVLKSAGVRLEPHTEEMLRDAG